MIGLPVGNENSRRVGPPMSRLTGTKIWERGKKNKKLRGGNGFNE